MMNQTKYMKNVVATVVTMIFVACSSEKESDIKFSTEEFRVTETSVELPKEATTRTLAVESNCDWDYSIAKPNEWADLTIQKTSDGLNIQTNANTMRASRSATVTLTTKGGISRTVNIVQAQGEVLLNVNGSTSITLSYNATGGTQELTVNCNTEWEIAGATDWLADVTPLAGNGTAKVAVTLSVTHQEQSRTAMLTITAEKGGMGERTSVVTITQNGATLPKVEYLRLTENTVDKHNASFTFSYSSEYEVTEYGFCYSTSSVEPSLQDYHQISDSGSLGTSKQVSAVLTELESATTYYVRAYVTSIIGTSYSNTVSLTTTGTEPQDDDNPKPNPR